MIRIVHCISSLAVGGAETALYRYASGDSNDCHHEVITLMPEAHYDSSLRDRGVAVTNLEIQRGRISLKGFRKLSNAVATAQPDVVMGWMYHSNLACVMHKFLGKGSAALIWNIRHSLDSLEHDTKKTRALIRASTLLSRYADAVVYNSAHAQKQHHELGYNKRRSHVIHNGVSPTTDVASIDMKRRLCIELGIDEHHTLVGAAGRFHTVKGHDVLLEAFALVLERQPDVRLIMCGSGVDSGNNQLCAQIERLGLSRRVHLLGNRLDIRQKIYPALDVFCSPSRSEGFPNVVAEAMNAGVPAVVTRTGESALLVGDAGLVCSPGNNTELASALYQMVSMTNKERKELGQTARRRVQQEFSHEVMCKKYYTLFKDIT